MMTLLFPKKILSFPCYLLPGIVPSWSFKEDDLWGAERAEMGPGCETGQKVKIFSPCCSTTAIFSFPSDLDPGEFSAGLRQNRPREAPKKRGKIYRLS